jgi:hypothetical protein
MPLQKIVLRPGLNREGTNYSNEGGWYDGDKIRFRSGNPEKIGGWTRLSDAVYQGVARNLWNWIDFAGNNYLGIGTNLKYYIEKGGAYNDVTPIRATFISPATNNCFTTATSSKVVKVTIIGHGGATDDFVTFSGITVSVGGVPASDLNGEHQITYIDANNFSILVATTATSPVTGGGTAITAAFQISTGLNIYVIGTGWGAGAYPLYIGTTLTNPFTAASTGVSVLTVTQTAHGLTTGDYVYFTSIAADPCGIDKTVLQKAFQITNTGANTYTISTVIGSNTYLTTSTAASGGAVEVQKSITQPAHGWGEGVSPGIGQQIRLWSNDNYGQDFIIAPRGGAIYYWIDATGLTVRATLLSTLATAAGYAGTYVPNMTNQVLSSALQRFVIAFGANSYVLGNPNTPFDPMLVRWSDQALPYQWVPNITNQSGEFRLTHGSYIVHAQVTRVETLVWTDSCLYTMQYLGPPYVYKFDVLADNISIISPNAAITINNVTYWMGLDKFYTYNGTVSTLPCSLKQYVFENLNSDQGYQIFVGGNSGYNEVWWFYCSKDTDLVNKYVVYNYLDQVWYSGDMARTAWLDSGTRPYPMAANYDYRMLYHEAVVDDVSGEYAVPIASYIQSSDFDIEDGQSFGFVWRMLPDVNFNGSNVNNPHVTMTIKPRQNSGAPYGTADTPVVTSSDNFAPPYPPNSSVYVIQEFTGQVYTRLRGRQMSFKIESDSLGVAWQLGNPRYDVRPDGRR